jgi:hypothetical protein
MYFVQDLDGWIFITVIGFTPGGSVKVQYIQSDTHTQQEEEHRNINKNEEHRKTEEHSNTENCTMTQKNKTTWNTQNT